MDNNYELICKLRSALQFYRENRELINMLRGMTEQGQNAQPKPREEHEDKKESRPQEERVDSMKILEEYLKRSAV